MLQRLQRPVNKGLQLQRCFSADPNIASAPTNRRSNGEAVSLAQSQGEARKAINPTPAEIYKMAQHLSTDEQQQLIAWLTQLH